ncbi:MAG: ATP-binding cassette domain-containing protein [Actinobacteria bacterium]|nr:ATP-binding cassette domain-containing protein [Actinomycetota bacterium]
MSDTPVLALDGVGQRHRLGRRQIAVLDAIAFELWPGEIVAILGRRRSGKTTLLRVAAGIEAPASGAVRLDGVPLGDLRGSARTRRLRAVGYVPKEWRVARGKPVLDHVALPLLADGRPLLTALAKAHEALERVGAGHCAGMPAEQLDPGEATRVALAQALVREPRVLLADEPGVMAAPDERDELLRLLRTLTADDPRLALVVTARDVAGVAGAGRVLTLDEGVLRGASEPPSAAVLPFPGGLAAQSVPAR